MDQLPAETAPPEPSLEIPVAEQRPGVAVPYGEWLPLNEQLKKVWRLELLINSGIIFLSFLGLEIALYLSDITVWFPGLGALAITATLFFLFFRMLERRFKSWGYAISKQDLRVRYGIWWRTQKFIPKSRIQHVDINSGPVSRMFGLVNLSVFAAGSMGEAAAIPGMTPEQAEALRQDLLTEDMAGV